MNLKNAEAEALMTKFIQEHPADWQVASVCGTDRGLLTLSLGTKTLARTELSRGRYQSLCMILRSCIACSAFEAAGFLVAELVPGE